MHAVQNCVEEKKVVAQQSVKIKMTNVSTLWMLMFAVAAVLPALVFGGDAGIIYGRKGDDLPSPKRVIEFLTKDMGSAVSLIRVYDANLEVLEALVGSNLVVTIGVAEEAIAYVASSQAAADKWFHDHVLTYVHKGVRFRYLCVGNEAIPGLVASLVQQAIANLYSAVRKAGTDYIQVTTAVGGKVLGSSYPPSTGQFAQEVAQIMNNLTYYLYSIGSPLLINVYPYYALVKDPASIALDYALFLSKTPVVVDGSLEYYNLFDAMVDAFVSAMVRVVQKEDVKVVVGATGWPGAGAEPYATIGNAQTYNQNLRDHARQKGWTPRKKDINLEVYILEMFNENLQRGGPEQHFGTFYPNFTELYPLWR